MSNGPIHSDAALSQKCTLFHAKLLSERDEKLKNGVVQVYTFKVRVSLEYHYEKSAFLLLYFFDFSAIAISNLIIFRSSSYKDVLESTVWIRQINFTDISKIIKITEKV